MNVLGLYPFALETHQGWSFEEVFMSFIMCICWWIHWL